MAVEQAERPVCVKHGPMALRASGTKEQAFCGDWYLCEHTEFGRTCGNTILLPSLELLAQLDNQRANLAKGSKR
ncbi:MAG: hypothetical protein JWO57_791 [Pseudonocardiales bacterium]|jgi:hypothetical protein|nr:hypothetical protein [Pseudonocardiales bacterium]